MSLVVPILLVAVAAGLAVGAILLVRRGAPDGSYFADGDRAAGVFGVITTGFSVLLGFIIFLGFESYDESRSGAETEATIVAQQIETAQFLPRATAGQLTGQLVCYARSVIGPEWEALEEGTLDDAINPWGAEMFRTLRATDPQTAAEQSAYDRWMDQSAERQQARIARIHGAEGIIPFPLWLVLFTIAGVIFVYMLFFADSNERAVVQALLMGSVVSVIVALLLLLNTLDDPFHGGVGGLDPVAMERSLRIIDEALGAVDVQVSIPCDAEGVAS